MVQWIYWFNIEENKWISKGVYTIVSNTVTITELPIGTWTEEYKTFLDKLETDEQIYSYKNMSSETSVHFEVKIPLENIINWKDNKELDKRLKMTSHISAKNMHMFNEKNEIVKMSSAEEIVYHFWKIRTDYYIKRKEYISQRLEKELNLITSKINFVNDVIDENVKVFRQKLSTINEQLDTRKYLKINETYTYLTDMKIHTFSEDTINELISKQKNITDQYNLNKNYTLLDFWENDLNKLN